MSMGIMYQSLQFHLISKGFFTWQDVFSLDVGIHHDHHGFIVRIVPDNYRHGIPACQLTGSFPSVAGNQFITSLCSCSYQCRIKYTVTPDAFYSFIHLLIIQDIKWMVFKQEQFRQRDFDYFIHASIICFTDATQW